jgi:acetoin utilization deacetylase AcuC-like enzyme
MGFCLINNVAVGAATLAEAGERVLIVDWDVHHGNGTQDIFWDDSRVLYVSTHQSPAYPGTGSAIDTGGPNARGLTVNVPLPPGSAGDAALVAFDEIADPVIEAFDPTWVLISAGFDAHRDDPLADLVWSAGDYAALTRRVAGYAPRPGRVVAYLEGGYDLRALGLSAGATVAALAGSTWAPEPPTSGGPGRPAVAAVKRLRERALEGQR